MEYRSTAWLYLAGWPTGQPHGVIRQIGLTVCHHLCTYVCLFQGAVDELLAQAKKDPVCSYMRDKLAELEDKGDYYEEEGEGTSYS